jgi:hypothetical protein
MRYDDVCSENIKRANAELNMWNDLEGITALGWKRIPVEAATINDHDHSSIDPTKYYMVCDNGEWFMGKFKRDYFNKGWGIYHGYMHPLGSINMIYELSGIPEVPKELIPKIKIKRREREVCYTEEELYGCECNEDVCTCNND